MSVQAMKLYKDIRILRPGAKQWLTDAGDHSCLCDGCNYSGVELRFEGSEELGYDPLGTPPRGEICLRGPIVFDGYYEDKKKTEESFGEHILWHFLSWSHSTPGAFSLWSLLQYLINESCTRLSGSELLLNTVAHNG